MHGLILINTFSHKTNLVPTIIKYMTFKYFVCLSMENNTLYFVLFRDDQHKL